MRRLPALVIAFMATAATAQEAPVVTSPAPERVGLTIYRAPNRSPGDVIDLRRSWQQGYALVTETRTVELPAGPATLRFEGVAGNIFAETAILADLPRGVTERNLDADLLSPRTLYDRALGRQVLVRRTDPATGTVRDEQATIRSSAAGAAVLQFAGGIEALRCSGLPETLVYSEPPSGLVAKPTLSIRTDSPQAARATVTLSYLAGGFDWQADYVVTMRPDGRADLFAWVTLASNDVTAFPAAATSVVAGKPKRNGGSPPLLRPGGGALPLSCWPTDISYGREAFETASAAMMAPPPPPPPPPPPAPRVDIMVTGAKRMAVQEDLGDLKLYRLPERTDVAPRSQKQVAMLERAAIPLDRIYVGGVFRGSAGMPEATLVTRNSAARGLGVPLPSGGVTVFGTGTRPLLLGAGRLEDRAIGEDVEIAIGASPAVIAEVEQPESPKGRTRYRLTVTNALPQPVTYEARIALMPEERIIAAAKLGRRGDARTWRTVVPANGRVTLAYEIRPAS